MKKISKLLLLLPLLCACACASKQAEKEPQYYIVEATGNAHFSIKLNDIPFCVNEFWKEANSWLLPGKNEISVEVLWPQAEGSDDNVSLEVKFYLADLYKGFSDEAKRYVTFTLPENADRSKPLVWEQTFTIPFVENLLLAKAETVAELTEEDKQEMIDRIEELKKAYADMDIERIYALQGDAWEDVARARYKSPDLEKEETTKAIEERFSITNLATPVEPLDAPKFEQMGRLVLVYFDDDPDPFTIKIDFEFDGGIYTWGAALCFAKVDGKWIILR